MGIGGWSRRGGWIERCLPALALLGSASLAAYGLSVAFRGYYVDVGWTVEEGWQQMIAWSPWPE